jgi:hypothetical protein
MSLKTAVGHTLTSHEREADGRAQQIVIESSGVMLLERLRRLNPLARYINGVPMTFVNLRSPVVEAEERRLARASIHQCPEPILSK